MNDTSPLPQNNVESKLIVRRSIIAFAFFLTFIAGSWATWRWLNNQPKEAGVLKPLRKTLNLNENISSAVYDNARLVKEYPLSAAAKNVRVNGDAGMTEVDEKTWRLKVVKAIGDTLQVSMDEIKKLPKKDVVFNFKCIEGWSQISHWSGVPLKTFMEHYHLAEKGKLKYMGLQTADKQYYVGIDMPSALHPQTLLCYEMNGKPLPSNQGFPLRLIIPVKYGIKHLKRLGTIYFSNQKPPDYWAERGYDYYAGH